MNTLQLKKLFKTFRTGLHTWFGGPNWELRPALLPGWRPMPQNRFSCCDSSASHSGLWQVFGTNMLPGRRPTPAVEPRSVDHRKQLHHLNSDLETEIFPGRRPTPAEEPRSVDHRKLYSADCCGISRFDRSACMACFRIGQSRKQGMWDLHIRTQKFAGKSVSETATCIRDWDGDVFNFTSMDATFEIL